MVFKFPNFIHFRWRHRYPELSEYTGAADGSGSRLVPVGLCQNVSGSEKKQLFYFFCIKAKVSVY